MLLPTLAQTPPAAHRPVLVMQTGVAVAVGHKATSAVPAATAEQAPSWPLLLQAMHVPVQAELQQTPSTQFPDRQSVPTMQARPCPSFSPHWLVLRLQVTPTQSVSPVHVVAHCHRFVASQVRYRPHPVVTAGGQAPLPLHVAAAVSMAGVVALPSVQARLRQPWVVSKNWQRAVPAALVPVLLPAQRPFNPHVMGAAMQTVAGSGSGIPAAMAVQVPVELRQVSQVPLHALVQQTPGVPSSM
jgi:hypothetical protein